MAIQPSQYTKWSVTRLIKYVSVATIFVLATLLLSYASGALMSSTTVGTRGYIIIPEDFYVGPFTIRSADMMADLLMPNFDDRAYATLWQEALDDLGAASPYGEITHVQMRIWWRINTGSGSTASDWINPQIGSEDGSQSQIMDNENWKRWYFGYIAPGKSPLAYGPSALDRIRQKGLRFEFALSGAWENGDIVKPPMLYWGKNEADYPDWMALGGGETFLDNYLNNVLLPAANFAKDYLEDGDIFKMSFEMVYPTADFTWSHNEKWTYVISAVRDVFRSAGKSVILTLDHCGWFDDFSLGYDAVELLNPTAPLSTAYKGISGATYLGELDYVSLSWWLPLILPEDVPASWSDADIPWVTEKWFDNKNFEEVGTGYNGVPAVSGRDMIADLRAFSQVIGKLVLMNTGWENRHGFLYTSPRRYSGNTPDNQEQRVAWAAQLAAIKDPRSNFTAWCAGQDFERYCRDKAAEPNFIDTSWRSAPAQTAIIDGIKAILGMP